MENVYNIKIGLGIERANKLEYPIEFIKNEKVIHFAWVLKENLNDVRSSYTKEFETALVIMEVKDGTLYLTKGCKIIEEGDLI